MLKVVLVIIVVVACPLLWTAFLVPLIARSFGVPIKIGALPIDRRDQRLSRRQSFWFGGILGWGIGLCLLGFLMVRLTDKARMTMPTLLNGLVGELVIGGFLSQSNCTYPLDRE